MPTSEVRWLPESVIERRRATSRGAQRDQCVDDRDRAGVAGCLDAQSVYGFREPGVFSEGLRSAAVRGFVWSLTSYACSSRCPYRSVL